MLGWISDHPIVPARWIFRAIAVCSLMLVSARVIAQQPTIKNTSVIPNQLWTDTGLAVVSGGQLSITAGGELDWQDVGCSWPNSNNCTSGPDGPGLTICNEATGTQNRPFTNLPCNSLIGKIGTDDGTAFAVGTMRTLTVPVSGELFLGVNDNYLPDNSIGWTATITYSPPTDCSAFVNFVVGQGAHLIETPRWSLDVDVRTYFGVKYLYVGAGSPTDPGILIDSDRTLVPSLMADPSNPPQTKMVQNLVEWDGDAEYGVGEDENQWVKEWKATIYPDQPTPLQIMDPARAPGSKGFYSTFLADAPEIHAPLKDAEGRPLRRINYTRTYKTFVGCTLATDPTFHPVYVIQWKATYQARITPIARLLGFIWLGYSPITYDPAESALGEKVETTYPPEASCETRYIDFNGKPTVVPECTSLNTQIRLSDSTFERAGEILEPGWAAGLLEPDAIPELSRSSHR